jgi:putrescine aminotransferase
MTTQRQRLAEAKTAYNHPTYARMSFVMGCGIQGPGDGSHVRDEHGDAYLALFDQYGNQSFGYSHPRIVAAIREQLDTGVLNSTKIMFEEVQIRLCERLAEVTGGRLPYAYLANGGGESIDNALKLARAVTRRPGFISAVDCFHGKTFGTLSASGRPEHLELYQPLLDHFHQVPFNDLDALARRLGTDTAAVILEPVQAEGGVIVPDPDYLREVRRMCTEAGALLILDEMQTAFGRCGEFFAHRHFGVEPDLVCVGKAFGGGVVPISAVLGTEAVWASLIAMPSTFGSSLGGNPLSCRVALEVIDIADDAEFLAGVRAKGRAITERLGALAARHPDLIRAHRGIGMMHGLDFHDEALGGLVLRLLLERRVTSTYSLYNNHVLRVQPPMVISDADLDTGLDALDDVMRTVAAYRRRHGTSLMPPVELELRVPVAPGRLIDLLHRFPHVLDPFAADPGYADAEGDPNAFPGTLGDDVVTWADTTETTDDGVVLRARPGWLWRRLDRAAAVAPDPDDPGAAIVAVRVGWDASTGPYEGLLAGRLRYHVTNRTADLAEALPARVAALIPTPSQEYA